MSASLLLLVDLVLGAGCAAAWIGAAVLAAMPVPRRQPAAGLTALGLLLVFGQLVTGLVLAARAWGFAQEKLTFAVPLQFVAGLLAAAIALPALLKPRSAKPALAAFVFPALVGAGIAACAGVLARTVVGFGLTPLDAVALAILVPLGAWIAWAVRRRERRQLIGAASLAALVLTSSVGYAWLSDVASPGALAAHAHDEGAAPAKPDAISVTDLRTPPDAWGRVQHYDLTARQETVTSPGGREISAWSFGSLPGPELRMEVGDLLEVTLHNEDIEEGVTIHWHGYDVPNGEDGVAGATQDPVMPGESFTYRFLVDDPGTYWYHTHQSAAEGIRKGLFGTLIVVPAVGIPEEVDLSVPIHTFGSTVWLGDSDLPRSQVVPEGTTVRLRLTNTDQTPHRFRLRGVGFRVIAVDSRPITGGHLILDQALRIPAGGRMDLAFIMPPDGVRLITDASSRVSLGLAPRGVDPFEIETRHSAPDLDLLNYGKSTPGEGEEGSGPVREETIVLDRLPRVLGGLPANAFVVNGAVFPHIPNIGVRLNEVVKITVINRGRDTHPMHIHGHHVQVLSRNGVPASGSELMVDTFDAEPGDVWEVQLFADNPGIWLDHCHNLDHAEQGMLLALAYEGVSTPFEHRHISG